ncbi:MAG: 1-deoxy-D-xylulose-5-phosphate reductoisomerase, partial [Lysobacteraceae bacterium]
CLRLARQALIAGPAATTVLNAANEVAVSAFLQGRLRFLGIPAVLESTLAQLQERGHGDLAFLLDLDARARRLADELTRSEA